MALKVWTSTLWRRGQCWLDISRAGKDLFGVVFAPSWDLVNFAMAARNRAKQIVTSDPAMATTVEDIMWCEYSGRYIEEMRSSYRAHRRQWDRLLSQETVTLCCYCAPGSNCHRILLADGILTKLGAEYFGER